MKPHPVILVLLLTVHAPAREFADPPATSSDVWFASQRQAADNARIIAQNERLIAAQEAAARPVYVPPPIVVSPGPIPPHLITTYPPRYFAEMAERLTREKRAREAAMWAKLKGGKP